MLRHRLATEGVVSSLSEQFGISREEVTVEHLEAFAVHVGRVLGIPPNTVTAGHLESLSIHFDRDLCRRSFYYYYRQSYGAVFGEFKDGWHMAAMSYHLQALLEEKLYTQSGDVANTLVINVPPGMTKSTTSCVVYPSWVWMCHPEYGQWFSSFSQPLCDRDSMLCRQVIMSDWYQKRWGDLFRITDDQNQKRLYWNDRGGWRLASSVKSGAGFGEHPNLFVWDDPLDPKQASSATEKQSVVEYWTDKISTRGVLKRVKRVIVMQRLAEDDPTDYILRNVDSVAHLCLPMEYEPERKCRTDLEYVDIDDGWTVKRGWEDPRTEKGELLWPDVYGESMVSQVKRDLQRAHSIAGQLQQRPTSPDGDMFLKESFTIVDAAPQNVTAVRAWDKASTVGRKSDYTAGALLLFDGVDYYLQHVVRFKKLRKERDAEILRWCRDDQERYVAYQVALEREGASGGMDAAEIHAESLSTEFRVKAYKAMGKPSSRDQRLKGWEVWAELLSKGRVKLVKGDWNKQFIDEHLSAPFGRNDDMIDAAALAARVLYGGERRQGRINRPLLLVTEDEERELEQSGCRCGGAGCELCGEGSYVNELHEVINRVFADDECELGVHW